MTESHLSLSVILIKPIRATRSCRGTTSARRAIRRDQAPGRAILVDLGTPTLPLMAPEAVKGVRNLIPRPSALFSLFRCGPRSSATNKASRRPAGAEFLQGSVIVSQLGFMGRRREEDIDHACHTLSSPPISAQPRRVGAPGPRRGRKRLADKEMIRSHSSSPWRCSSWRCLRPRHRLRGSRPGSGISDSAGLSRVQGGSSQTTGVWTPT